jgi:outer membrane protein TolC
MNVIHLLHSAGRASVWGIVLTTSVASAQTLPSTVPVAPPQATAAGSTLTLTLEDAVRRAVDHNPDLAIVRLGTNVEAARVAEARSAYVPVFNTKFARTSSAAAPSSFLPGAGGIDTKDWFSSTGLQQRLQLGGGTWTASWDTARTATNSPFTAFDPALQSGLQLAFSQPLFRDRAIDAARVQYVIAKRDLAGSELRFRQSVVQTVAAVKQAYWTFKALTANVTVQQRSLDLAQDLVRQNQARVKVGEAPPLDLVQAQAEVANRRESLIRAQAAAKDAEDGLRRLIMDPADASFWQIPLDAVDDPASDNAPVDVDRATATALSGRYDLSLLRQQLDNANTNIKYFGNQKLPDVRLEASYRGGGFGGTQLVRTGTFPGVVTGTANSGFGNVLGQLFSQDFPTWSVGVTVSYPIGQSYEESSLARAQIERDQTTHTIESLKLQIVQGIRQAARQVQSTGERVDAARASEGLAQQRVEVETKRFAAGLSTTFLVTQAQRDLVQAQVDLLQAMLDHQSALIAFEAVQLAGAPGQGASIGLSNADVVALPPASPQGIFRAGGGS